MKMQTPEWIGPAAWGAVFGAAALAVLGFSYFGWVLGGTAERMAAQRAETAVTAGLLPICLDRFRQQPDAAARLAQLRQTSSWMRREFVERGAGKIAQALVAAVAVVVLDRQAVHGSLPESS